MKPVETILIFLTVISLFIFVQSRKGVCYVNNQPVQVRNIDNCI